MSHGLRVFAIGFVTFVSSLFAVGAQAIVGALSGQYQTTHAGTAAYVIPIDLPPGIGVKPSLSLVYDSSAGEGIAGLGWRLKGGEAITRCPATRHQDGFFDPVDFDDNDRYCLDGQRLVAVKGVYGQDGTEYRTEIDTYARIISYGDSFDAQGHRTGPEYFEVWLKSGEIKVFGQDPRSRVRIGAGSVLTWNLSQVRDRFDNRILYDYYNSALDDPGKTWVEVYLRGIEYSATRKEAPLVHVALNHVSRNRPLVSYRYGTEFRTSVLLESVRITGANGRFVREYVIEHASPTTTEPRYRVTRIGLCVKPGHRDCVRPVEFTMGKPPAAKASAPVFWAERQYAMGFDMSHWPMDIDGDGLTDMVYNRKGTPDYRAIVNDGKGRTHEILWARRVTDVGYDPQHWVGDVDGDGRMDLIYNEAGTDRYHVLVSQGRDGTARDMVMGYRGTGKGGDRHWVMDLDADGRSDLVFRSGRKYYVILGGHLCDPGSRWCNRNNRARYLGEARYDLGLHKHHYPIDVNGDGLTDLVYGRKGHPEYRVLITRLGSDGYPHFEEMRWGVRAHEVGYEHQHWILDANGDGLADLLYKEDDDDDRYYVLINTGNPFDGQGFVEKFYGQRKHDNLILKSRHIVMDVNADGRSDVLFVERSGSILGGVWYHYYVMLSGPDGTRMGATRLWASSNIRAKNDAASHWQMDIDGDGLNELMVKDPNSRKYYALRDRNAGGSFETSEPLNRLVEIGNGLGARTRIHYLPFSSPEIYRNEKGTGYPVRHSPPVGLGVRRVSTTNGSQRPGDPEMNEMIYAYYSSRLDQRRHVSLGFEKVVEYNPQTDMKAETRYYQEFPVIGQVRESRTRHGKTVWKNFGLFGSKGFRIPVTQWTTIKHTTVTFPDGTSRTRDGIESRYYQVLGSRTSTSEYEIKDGSLIKTQVVENRQLDDFGNPRIVISRTSGFDGSFVETVTKNQYENDLRRWLLGRLVRAEARHRSHLGEGALRVSAFEYDGKTGVLKKEIVEPDDKAFYVRKEYKYDKRGTRTEVRTSAGRTRSADGKRSYKVDGTKTKTRIRYKRLLKEGLLEVETTNAVGHKEKKIIDALTGQAIEQVDPNGIRVQFAYDGLQRQIDTWTEVQKGSVLHQRTSYGWCDAAAGCPSDTVYFVHTQSDDGAESIEYHDRLGRVIVKAYRGLNGEWIAKRTEYDRLGRVWRTSQPYYLDDGPQYWTDFEYDDLGRVIREHRPDGGYVRKEYDHLTVTTWQGGPGLREQRRKVVRDVSDNIVRVVDDLNHETRYTYDANGNLVRVTDAAGNVTRAWYNRMGWRIRVEDPDMGTVETEYDALGRPRWERDANGNVTRTEYDRLDRVVKLEEYDARLGKKFTTTWKYDKAKGAGKGRLAEVRAPGDYRDKRTYDDYGHLVRRELRLGSDFRKAEILYRYDAYGRKQAMRSPSGLWVSYVYNAYGHLVEKREGEHADGRLYWQAQAADVFGNVVQEEFGNGLVSNRVYDYMGRVQSIFTSSNDLGAEVQDLSYRFDALGNLIEREDHRQGLREKFAYDTLNRLIAAELVGVGTRRYAYDALGNILRKGNVTDYRYGEGGAGPHAVTHANGKRYYYDRNGNMISGGGREILWSAFDKPVEIRKGSTSIRFFYGPDKARYKQVKEVDGKVTVTWYVGKFYERVAKNGQVTHKDYIGVGHATLIREKTGNKVVYKYLFKDHLGSTDVVTDATGKVLERSSFAPFGERRQANWRPATGFLTAQTTTRGYTGHEQLDEVGLIHMNGRVYDPELGRFLSPDPNVQAPLNAQNLNRYSYVLNNPLSYTDPSGFFFDKLGDLIQDLASNPIVRSVAMIGCSTATQGVGTAVCAGVVTAAFTRAAGGSWDDALQAGAFAAVSSAIAGQIGDLHHAGVINTAEAAALHGLAQGALAAAQGRSFAANFAAAAFSKVASPQVGRLPGGTPVRVVASAVIGGTASRITGGRFANGAMSSAFVYLFNDAIHRPERSKDIEFKVGTRGNGYDMSVLYKGKVIAHVYYDDPDDKHIKQALSAIKTAFATKTFAAAAEAMLKAGKGAFTVNLLRESSPDLGYTEKSTINLYVYSDIDDVSAAVVNKVGGWFTWDIVFMHEVGHVVYNRLVKPSLCKMQSCANPSHWEHEDRNFWEELSAVNFENQYRSEMYPSPLLRHSYRKPGDFDVVFQKDF